MARVSVPLEGLPGQARNPVPSTRALTPHTVFNLVPDRLGGYVPYGRTNSVGISLQAGSRLVGWDETGISSWRYSGSTVALFLGSGVHTRSASNLPGGVVGERGSVHLDGAGFYYDRDEYLVFEQQHPDRGYRIAVEPIGGASGAQVPDDDGEDEGSVRPGAGWTRMATDESWLMAAAPDGLWLRRVSGGAWRRIHENPGPGHRFRYVRYEHGLWVALASASGNVAAWVFAGSDPEDLFVTEVHC